MEECYPKTLYHRGGGSALVTSSSQEKALGSEWSEVPPLKEVPLAPASSAGLIAVVGDSASDNTTRNEVQELNNQQPRKGWMRRLA